MDPSESPSGHRFRWCWLDWGLLAAVLALSLLTRWLTLQPIESGGDPLDNWFVVREWAYQTNLATARIDHHAARIGIHWVTFLVQSVCGSHPQYYFLPSFLIANACALLVYALGARVAGRLAAVLAVVWFLDNRMIAEAAAQLRRGIFECFYALITLNCLVLFCETSGRSRFRWLIACTVATFFGYLTEISFLFLAPGVLFVLWRAGATRKELAVYVGGLAVLFLLETAFYTFFTHYRHRLHVLYSFHLGRPTLVVRKYGYLLERFTEADRSLKAVFYPFFLLAPALLIWGKSLRGKALILPTASFLFLMTFLVRRIYPLVTFTSNNDRYLMLAVPPAIICVCAALAVFAERGYRWIVERVPRARLSLAANHGSLLVGGVALVLLIGAGTTTWHRRAGATRPFARIRADYAALNDAYARELPIVAKVTSRKRGLLRARALHWVYKGFIADDLLVKNGSLPSWAYSQTPAALNDDYHYLPKSPRLNPTRVRELRAKGCAIEARETSSGVELRPRGKLPAGCKP
jgi:hypothetical protein